MIPKNVKEIMQKLLDAGHEAFIVGGAVRDIVLGREPHDFDIFTDASPETVFPKGSIIGNEDRQKKILTVIVGDVEVSRYRGNGDRTEFGKTLRDHVNTCDFTINAIAMTLQGNIIDYTGGMGDLKNKILRAVGDAKERFNEDLLRILRLVRFQLKYGFQVDVATMMAMQETVDKITDLPAERLRDELFNIMNFTKAMQRLLDYNILQKIIPEVRDLSIEGGEMHAETVIQHCVNAFETACTITDNTLLRFAAFMHDIGKGQTFTKEDGIVHFYRHENVGEELVGEIMNRLKFSTEDKRTVKCLIRTHMFSFKENNGEPSKKSYAKFFAKIEAAKVPIESYVMLIYADHQGNDAKKRIKFGDFISGNWLHKKYYEMKHSIEPFTVKDLAISGKDLMELGMEAGPKIGEILERMFAEVMNGKLKNVKPDMLNAARKLVNKDG